MFLNALHYYESSTIKIKEADTLYDASKYPGSIYLYGVAVESLLRAIIRKNSEEIDKKHDLPRLYTKSGFSGSLSRSVENEVSAAFGDLWSRWNNLYRYADNKRIYADICSRKIDRSAKGPILKQSALKVRNSAHIIIREGGSVWRLKKS